MQRWDRMPGWARNILTFTLDESSKDNFLKEIEGPSDWMMPGQFPYLNKLELTNHQKMEYKNFLNKGNQYLKELIYQKERKYTSTPWIPISEEDVHNFIMQELKISCRNPFGHSMHKIIVPFSLPKLLPWIDENEFKTFFPGSENKDGLWEKDPKEIQNYNTKKIGRTALYKSKLNGGDLPPASEVRIKDITTLSGQSTITIVFITSWKPIKDIDLIMQDILKRFKAKIAIRN